MFVLQQTAIQNVVFISAISLQTKLKKNCNKIAAVLLDSKFYETQVTTALKMHSKKTTKKTKKYFFMECCFIVESK